MNVAEIKHFTQNKIKNDILGFLDQAIKGLLMHALLCECASLYLIYIYIYIQYLKIPE